MTRRRRKRSAVALNANQPWILPEVRHPSEARNRRSALPFAPSPVVFDAALWCHELHLQVARIAADRRIDIVLIGGQAASLRFHPLQQRASSDNDYIVAVPAETVIDLVQELANGLKRDAPGRVISGPRRLHGPPGPKLPLVVFELAMAPITGDAPVTVKLEFHLEGSLPPTDSESGIEVWTSSEGFNARIPRVPYQIAMKLLTLAEPPVGLPPDRIDALPRQVYDLDGLTLLVDSVGAFDEVLTDRINHEQRTKAKVATDITVNDVALTIARRLMQGVSGGFQVEITRFQTTQLFGENRRSPQEWRARFARILLFTYCHFAPHPVATWSELLDQERAVAGGSPMTPAYRGKATEFWINQVIQIVGDEVDW